MAHRSTSCSRLWLILPNPSNNNTSKVMLCQIRFQGDILKIVSERSGSITTDLLQDLNPVLVPKSLYNNWGQSRLTTAELVSLALLSAT